MIYDYRGDLEVVYKGLTIKSISNDNGIDD